MNLTIVGYPNVTLSNVSADYQGDSIVGYAGNGFPLTGMVNSLPVVFDFNGKLERLDKSVYDRVTKQILPGYLKELSQGQVAVNGNYIVIRNYIHHIVKSPGAYIGQIKTEFLIEDKPKSIQTEHIETESNSNIHEVVQAHSAFQIAIPGSMAYADASRVLAKIGGCLSEAFDALNYSKHSQLPADSPLCVPEIDSIKQITQKVRRAGKKNKHLLCLKNGLIEWMPDINSKDANKTAQAIKESLIFKQDLNMAIDISKEAGDTKRANDLEMLSQMFGDDFLPMIQLLKQHLGIK